MVAGEQGRVRKKLRVPEFLIHRWIRTESQLRIKREPRQGNPWIRDARDTEGSAKSGTQPTSRVIPRPPPKSGARSKEWGIAAEQALRSAKACGHEPAGVDRPLSESRQSRQDWRALLRDFVAATRPSDYRWSPPNRRYIASGLYLPSVERRGLGEIVIAVDTSGSIGRLELEQFAGEISAISEEAQPEAIHVVYCDAAVQSAQQFGPSEPVGLEPRAVAAQTSARPSSGSPKTRLRRCA